MGNRNSILRWTTAAALVIVGSMAGLLRASDTTLLVWINGDKGYNGLQKVGNEFTKKTGVKVVVEHPEDAPGKFQQAAAEGKGPDIWIWAHDRVGEWKASGLLQEVNPSKKVKDGIDPLAWKAFTIGGKTWGYPISIEAIGLIYNKALVKTPPKTFEEIFALDKKLQGQGKHAILWDYNNTYFTFPLLAANGGYAFKQRPDGSYDPKDVGVNNPGAVKGAEMLNRLIKEGVMPKGAGYADMEAGMAEGKVAMMISGPWAWENVEKAKIHYGVAKLPSVGGKKAVPFVGVIGAMIPKASKQPALAKEFIENYMLSVQGLKTINADVPLGTPANKAFYQQLKSDPRIQATMASAQDGVVMPNNPEMGRFWSAMLSALGNMTEGRKSPKDAMDAAAKRILAK
nr:maltose/maltodextrin ABC transporter substrate-binding protein MalE [uncultured Holophaga sp.]